MRKKILKSVIISIIVTLIFSVDALANDLPPGSNIGGGVTSNFVGCAAGSVFCWDSHTGQGRIQGVRITVVDQNGNRYGTTKSYDFFKCDGIYNDITYNFLTRNNVNYYKNKLHKNAVIAGGMSKPKDWDTGQYQSGGNAVCVKERPIPKFNGESASVLKPYFLKVASKTDNLFESFFIPTYLERLGYNYKAELEKLKTDPDHFKKQALLIEPIVFFRITSKRGGNLNWTREYAGTATEVAKMLNSPDSKDPGYTGSDVYFDLIQQTKKVNGKTVTAKYRGYHFNNPTPFNTDFPLAIYVDDNKNVAGLAGVKNWVDAGKITNYASELLTKNGVAAGHVWLNELVCPAPKNIKDENLPTCCNELIDANMVTNNNYGKCCKELFDKNKLTRSHLPKCCSVLPTSHSLYKSYCEQKINDSCKWKLDITCPDNCDKSSKGEVKDMDDWGCIFKSRTSSIANVRNHFYEWGNRYCDVYCREEVDYQFPKGSITVLAGHHFTVGFDRNDSWSPIRFNGESECRTTSDINKIKFEQFQKDYDAQDSKLPQLWRRYQLEIARDKSRNNARSSGSRNCDYYCDHNVRGIKCCKEADRDCDSCYYGSSNECVGGTDSEGKYDSCLTTKNTCSYGCSSWYCVDDDDPYDHGYWMTPTPEYQGVFGPVTERGWCTSNGSGREPTRPSSQTPAARSNYYNTLDLRDSYVPLIKRCNDWQRDYSHFSPSVFLNYEEDIYGLNEIELSKKIRTDVYTDFYVGSSYSRNAYRKTLKTTKHECSTGQECVPKQLEYPANDNIRQFSKREINYGLPNNIYQYVSKPPGYSSHTRPPIQYIDMSYSNLPVHYSRLENLYNISLEYKTFGRNHKFNKYVFDGVPFTGNYRDSVKCETLYECKYKVRNDFMYCDGRVCKDLQVIFRPVSLSNPFPGKSGGGRSPGENWRWDVSKITRNRNLNVPERIYFDREPMYEINLNTFSILSIRSHNRNVSGGYSDFNLTCLTGKGEECKSQFIRNKFIAYFNKKLCGMSNDWGLCGKSDLKK